MIDEHEARLAVECAALCGYRECVYYAHSLVYTKNPRGRPMWSIVLQDRTANSTVQAPFEQVCIVKWNLPEALVRKHLAAARAKK